MKIMQDSLIQVLNWNVRNPGLARAKDQCLWLGQQNFDVIILTELKSSAGYTQLHDWLIDMGYSVFPSRSEPESGYRVLLGIRGMSARSTSLSCDVTSQRAVAAAFRAPLGDLRLLGLYVPSRGPAAGRNLKKREFQCQVANTIRDLVSQSELGNLLIAGDMNVVERGHIPRYAHFGEWEYAFYDLLAQSPLVDAFRHLHPSDREYSWIGHSGNGYRFDHFFISQGLLSYVKACFYIHDPRELQLSDHSAMSLTLESLGTVTPGLRAVDSDSPA